MAEIVLDRNRDLAEDSPARAVGSDADRTRATKQARHRRRSANRTTAISSVPWLVHVLAAVGAILLGASAPAGAAGTLVDTLADSVAVETRTYLNDQDSIVLQLEATKADLSPGDTVGWRRYDTLRLVFPKDVCSADPALSLRFALRGSGFMVSPPTDCDPETLYTVPADGVVDLPIEELDKNGYRSDLSYIFFTIRVRNCYGIAYPLVETLAQNSSILKYIKIYGMREGDVSVHTPLHCPQSKQSRGITVRMVRQFGVRRGMEFTVNGFPPGSVVKAYNPQGRCILDDLRADRQGRISFSALGVSAKTLVLCGKTSGH